MRMVRECECECEWGQVSRIPAFKVLVHEMLKANNAHQMQQHKRRLGSGTRDHMESSDTFSRND